MTDFRIHRLTEYTETSLVAEMQRVAQLIPSKIITISQFQKHARVGVSTLRRHFGSWNKALLRAGLSERCSESKATEKTASQIAKNMTDDDVMKEIQRIATKLGKPNGLRIDEFDQHSDISHSTARKRFGSWRKALEYAGLSAGRLGRRYTDEECFKNLLNVWTYHGRSPKTTEMCRSPSKIGYRAYTYRWGTWIKALEAFVQRTKQDLDTPSHCDKSKKHLDKVVCDSNKTSAEKREIKLGLRYKVLKRDNFRCVMCGRSPATEQGCELHVDHIIPFSKGGKTILDNLRSACRECNLGKGNRE